MKTVEFLSKIEKIKYDELLSFYDSLGPVNIDDVISRWEGHDINLGHACSDAMQAIRWWGKWYISADEAIPLVVFNEQRNKLYSDKGLMRGEASLKMVEFRGVVSTTMVYDSEPVFDHFRKVNDDIVLGCMNGKVTSSGINIIQNGQHYFWWMRKVALFPCEFQR